MPPSKRSRKKGTSGDYSKGLVYDVPQFRSRKKVRGVARYKSGPRKGEMIRTSWMAKKCPTPKFGLQRQRNKILKLHRDTTWSGAVVKSCLCHAWIKSKGKGVRRCKRRALVNSMFCAQHNSVSQRTRASQDNWMYNPNVRGHDSRVGLIRRPASPEYYGCGCSY